ncbi:MAG: hypothetical protein M3478_07680 [Planctomycetota bacterium]|nr:hypothetical protein [Planctomycetota bacterium]
MVTLMTVAGRSVVVLDYRQPLADRPLTRLTTWLATPMSPRWRTAVIASSCLVLWGAAWLPGALAVESLGWFGLIICATHGLVRRPLRWIVRKTHGLPSVRGVASERYAPWQLLLLAAAASSPIYWWPLRVSLFIQRPFIDRFGWHVYAEAPMLYPPATPRMAGLFIVTQIHANPNGALASVLGSGGGLSYGPNGAPVPFWLKSGQAIGLRNRCATPSCVDG